MSLFTGEFPSVRRITLRQDDVLGTATNPPYTVEGHVWNDPVQKTIFYYSNGQKQGFQGTLSINKTPVTNTNATAATNLMAGYAFPAGALNIAGKTFAITAAGTYNLGAASTNVFLVNLGAVTLATFTSGSNANTGVDLPWQLYLTGTTASTGATGTVEVQGALTIDIGATAGAAATSYIVSAVSSAIDLTAAETLQIQANLGTGNASSNQKQRFQFVEFFN